MRDLGNNFNKLQPICDKNQKIQKSELSDTNSMAGNWSSKINHTVSCLSSVFRSIPNPGYLLIAAPGCAIALLTLAGRCIADVTSASTPPASKQLESNSTAVNASVVITSTPPVIPPKQEPAWIAEFRAQNALIGQSVKTEDQGQCDAINSKQKNFPNHCSPVNPSLDIQSVKRQRYSDRFVEIHQTFNLEILDRANEVIDRDHYFFSSPPKTRVEPFIKPGATIFFVPKSESNVFQSTMHLLTHENSDVNYIGKIFNSGEMCAEFDDQGKLKNKAEIRKKLLDDKLKPGSDALADLTTDALELMAEKSSWAARRVKIYQAYVIRSRITAEAPITELPWWRDSADTRLLVQMNEKEKVTKDCAGYVGGGINFAQGDPHSSGVIENTIKRFDFYKNSGFLITLNKGNLRHQVAEAEYIGKASGVAEKRLFWLSVTSKESDIQSCNK